MSGKDEPHVPELCFCGHKDKCACPCEYCVAKNADLIALEKRLATLQKLEELGIDLDDLTTMVWMRIEPEVEARIAKLVNVLVHERLRRLVLQSKVEWSSL